MALLALLMGLTLSQAAFSGASYYDYIYKDHAKAFYEAHSEQEFLDKKHSAYGQVILNGLTPLLISAASYLIYRHWPSKTESHPQVRAVTFGGFTFFVSTLFSGLIQTTLAPYIFELQEPITGFVNSLRNYIFGAPQDDVQKLELKYIRIKPQLTSKTHLALESRFEKIRTTFRSGQYLGTSDSKEPPELRVVKQILALPITSKPIQFDNSLFLEEFSGYQNMTSANLIPKLEHFCGSLVIASRHTNPRLKLPLYLLGPPGVGKTEAALKLGKVLGGIPVIKINLAEFSNIGQIKGTHCKFPEDDQCTPGFIAHKIMGYPDKNAILFFDEADQVLNRIHEGQSHELVSLMLDLLEGKIHFINNPYFETELDIRYFGIILAGNSRLTNKALNNRPDTLEFGNYTQEYRIKAGRERFLPEILQDYSEVLTLQNFTKQDYEHIDAIAIAEHQKLLDDQEDPGFRNQIRQIERFVHQKAQGSKSFSQY